jgi:regulator of PEP synthase PpsR (kinase-PPPase family)
VLKAAAEKNHTVFNMKLARSSSQRLQRLLVPALQINTNVVRKLSSSAAAAAASRDGNVHSNTPTTRANCQAIYLQQRNHFDKIPNSRTP